MLIDAITQYCNDEYHCLKESNTECRNCNHKIVNGLKCPDYLKSCKTCFKEIHYPQDYPNGKKDYDCYPIIDFYTCCYAFKYASEMLYLYRCSDLLDDITMCNVFSIGCGACPDLMALEQYDKDEGITRKINYWGLDYNNRWKHVHSKISEYCSVVNIETNFIYEDVIRYFEQYKIENTNVLVLEYVISSMINSGEIDRNHIDRFYRMLIEKIVLNRNTEVPFIIFINDVNHYAKGRDDFMKLHWILKNDYQINSVPFAFYFDYNINNEGKKFGDMHEANNLLFRVPVNFNYYSPWLNCSSAQFMIEIDKE